MSQHFRMFEDGPKPTAPSQPKIEAAPAPSVAYDLGRLAVIVRQKMVAVGVWKWFVTFAAGLFLLFIWPTIYRYETTEGQYMQVRWTRVYRINRITGHTKMMIDSRFE